MKYEKYLPLGTVVMLKDASKRLMIIGFCTSSNDNKEVIYDYSGCLYPEGVLSSDKSFLFNHNQIAKIYCLGLSDEEEKKFKINLKETMKNL